MKLKIAPALAGCALVAVSLAAAAQPAAPAHVSAPISGIVDRSARVGTRRVHYFRAGTGATSIVLLRSIGNRP